MKIILISDTHSNNACLAQLKQLIKLEKPDGLICCGDICQGDDLDYLEKFFSCLESVPKSFLITGNNDGANVRRRVWDSKHSAQLVKRKIGKDYVFGISDGEILDEFDSADIAGTILLTHRPPLKNILETPFANAPKYHLSGHLHSQYGLVKYAATTHIKIPSFQKYPDGLGMYGLFDPDSNTVKYKKIG